MNRHKTLAGGSAAFLAANTIGRFRIAFDNPENLGAAVMQRLDANHTETKGLFTKADERLGKTETQIGEVKESLRDMDARIADAEQKAARRGGGGGLAAPKSWGQRFVESDEYKSAEGHRDRQGQRFRAEVASTEIEHKNITSVTASGGSLVQRDQRVNDISLLPWNQFTVRDLVAPGTTNSNSVSYPRMTSRTVGAAMVAEGALKPQSDLAFEEVTAPVRTLAHYFLATRQILDDAPALAATIDAEARAGLADVEDAQLLFGDGTGQNLFGLVPQASAFVKQWTNAMGSPLDVLIQAIAQVEALNWKVDGMVLNAVDWRMLQAMKDTQGRYIGNSPFEASVLQRIWQTPVATTNRMPKGTFLVGPFKTQAQIFDRMGVEVLASSEDGDNFRRNLITLRAEERLAFTVKRPASFVTGSLTASLA
ncbi:phage major capsid protein [Methylobacterium sp. CM6247]